MTGICKGKRILLPRIHLTPSDLELPFILCRQQFPIRLAYSMTINKSPGQTFDKVGIYLQRPCFTHGQLYVAFSRARNFQSIKVKVVPTTKQGSVDGKHIQLMLYLHKLLPHNAKLDTCCYIRDICTENYLMLLHH